MKAYEEMDGMKSNVQKIDHCCSVGALFHIRRKHRNGEFAFANNLNPDMEEKA
jgi:hypothetical protein